MPFKYLTSLRILCEHGGKPKWSIDLSLEGKSKIKKAANQDYPGIECGMSSGAQAYNVGDRLRTMAAQLLADVRPDSKFHNEIVRFARRMPVSDEQAPERKRQRDDHHDGGFQDRWIRGNSSL